LQVRAARRQTLRINPYATGNLPRSGGNGWFTIELNNETSGNNLTGGKTKTSDGGCHPIKYTMHRRPVFLLYSYPQRAGRGHLSIHKQTRRASRLPKLRFAAFAHSPATGRWPSSQYSQSNASCESAIQTPFCGVCSLTSKGPVGAVFTNKRVVPVRDPNSVSRRLLTRPQSAGRGHLSIHKQTRRASPRPRLPFAASTQYLSCIRNNTRGSLRLR
jgi:hypothetical protein